MSHSGWTVLEERVLEGVRRLARCAQDHADLRIVERVLGEELIAVLEVDQAHIVDFEHGSSLGTCLTVVPQAPPALVGLSPDRTGAAVQRAMRTRAPVWVGSQPDALPPEIAEAYSPASALVLPLDVRNAVRRVVVVGHRYTRVWAASEVTRAETLVAVAADAVALSDARRRFAAASRIVGVLQPART